MPTEFRRSVKTPEQQRDDQERREREAEKADRLRNERTQRNIELRNSWFRIKEEPAIANLVKFLETRRDMLTLTATSGVGQVKKQDGANEYMEEIRFTSEQRISQMDRIAGITEALDNIAYHLGKSLQAEEEVPYNADNDTEQVPTI